MTTKTGLLSLGLDDRDQLNQELGGGFPIGSIVLMEGDYGAGKSALTQRFAFGLCETGNKTTVLSTELRFNGFVNQMNSLGYDVVDHIIDQNLVFLPVDLDRNTFTKNGEKSERKELLSRLMEAEVMWSTDVVIIDTFDAILRNDPLFEALIKQNDERQAALEIISFFRRIIADGTVIVITLDPSTVDDEVVGPFRAIADAYLQLEMIEVGNDIRRQILVKRFAGMGEQVGDRVGFSVRADTGIVIESRSVA